MYSEPARILAAAAHMIEKLIVLAIVVALNRLLAQLERLIEKLENLF